MVNTPTLAITDLGTGTTGTATISGSTALTTNTLYYQSVDNRGDVWQSYGSRTGDGTISITGMSANLYRWWHVSSTDGSTAALSNLVYQPLLSDDDAFHERCLQGTVARLQELTLDGIPTTRIYDQAFVHDDNVQMPCVVVAIHDQSENEVPGVCQREDYGYPVYVIIMADAPQKATDWRPDVLKWREQCVRALVNHQITGINENFKCSIEFAPVLMQSPTADEGRVYSAFVARWFNRLTRGLT